MRSNFTPLVISLQPCTEHCALVWSDGRQCETADFASLADAHQAFNALCQNYPRAVRIINGEVQNSGGFGSRM